MPMGDRTPESLEKKESARAPHERIPEINSVKFQITDVLLTINPLRWTKICIKKENLNESDFFFLKNVTGF